MGGPRQGVCRSRHLVGATPFVGAGAGFAYKVTPGLTLELAYRYLDLGSSKSGDLIDSITGFDYGAIGFNHLSSQDLTLGMRWMFEPAPRPGQFTPLVSKG